MNAATAHTKSERGKPDPIRGRTPARLVVALLVTLVAGIGVWGALSATRGVQAYQHATRLESAVAQARYTLVLERSAIRDPQSSRGRRELGKAAAAFLADVRLVRDAGREQDKALAALLRTRNARLLETARQVLAARDAGDAASAQALLRESIEPQAAQLDDTLARSLADVRGQSANAWPAEPVQKLELAAVALLVALGLASAAIFLMRLVGYRRRLEGARREALVRLEEQALSDNLTGLGNHRAFYEDLKHEIARRARTGSCFSIVMLDLDRLKEINDTFGHQAGDDRIRAVADCLKATVRGSDGGYRIGGDEFMALLPGERAWGALTFSQRLHAEIAQRGETVGVSCGVVESAALESSETLVRRADVALYEAKHTGRRIVIYSDGLGPRSNDRPEDAAARRHHRLLATALAQAVDAKDSGTRNHCETVSTLCVLIGQALGLGGERLEQLRLAGLLHDVGKIGIADAVLQKPEGLDSDERRAMSVHVDIGQALVAAAGLAEEADWVLHHHEHLDGNGYPGGLSGTTIPLESRIILVADAFEAMTADRPYRSARKPAEAFRELEAGAGTQFDPDCVEALRSVLEGDGGPDAAPLSMRLTPAEETLKTLPPHTEPKVVSV